MTTGNFNSNEQDSNIKPLFEHFQWHRKEVDEVKISGSALTNLAGKVRDIASGCATIMEMIEFDDIQGTLDGGKRLMDNNATGNLRRLAIQSLELLSIEAEEAVAWAYDYHTEAGKAGMTRR